MTDINAITQERGKRYGKFEDHAEVTQRINEAIKYGLDSNQQFKMLHAKEQRAVREGLHMIAHKIGRIATGDATYDDSWIDIEGYSKITREFVAPSGGRHVTKAKAEGLTGKQANTVLVDYDLPVWKVHLRDGTTATVRHRVPFERINLDTPYVWLEVLPFEGTLSRPFGRSWTEDGRTYAWDATPRASDIVSYLPK